MRIGGPARKHGVADESIRHAVRCSIRETDHGDGVLIIGPDESGRLLEILVIDLDKDPVVIHAMPARRTFLPQRKVVT